MYNPSVQEPPPPSGKPLYMYADVFGLEKLALYIKNATVCMISSSTRCPCNLIVVVYACWYIAFEHVPIHTATFIKGGVPIPWVTKQSGRDSTVTSTHSLLGFYQCVTDIQPLVIHASTASQFQSLALPIVRDMATTPTHQSLKVAAEACSLLTRCLYFVEHLFGTTAQHKFS